MDLPLKFLNLLKNCQFLNLSMDSQ